MKSEEEKAKLLLFRHYNCVCRKPYRETSSRGQHRSLPTSAPLTRRLTSKQLSIDKTPVKQIPRTQGWGQSTLLKQRGREGQEEWLHSDHTGPPPRLPQHHTRRALKPMVSSAGKWESEVDLQLLQSGRMLHRSPRWTSSCPGLARRFLGGPLWFCPTVITVGLIRGKKKNLNRTIVKTCNQ